MVIGYGYNVYVSIIMYNMYSFLFLCYLINHQYEQGISSTPEKFNVPQRLASLIRFREKRKERNFDKKIRYTVRKEVALRYDDLCSPLQPLNSYKISLSKYSPSSRFSKNQFTSCSKIRESNIYELHFSCPFIYLVFHWG